MAAPHGTLTATLWANVGSRVSRNGSGKSATTVILWDRVPAFWGIGIGSVYDSGRYITLAGTRLWLAHVYPRVLLIPLG